MIPNIKKILFATDLTKGAHRAYQYALSIASRFDASVTILYVMEEPSVSFSQSVKDFLGEDRWQKVQKSHEEHAKTVLIGKRNEAIMIKEALGEFSEEARKTLADIKPVETEVVVSSGNAVNEILSEAQTRACDLIVMGYHVRGKFEETVLGSTSRRVLRRGNIPVMLVRISDDE